MKISNQNQLKDFFQKRLEILKLKMKEMKLKNGKKKIKQKDLIYKTNTYKYHFQHHQTTRPFGKSIYTAKIYIHEAKMDQSNLLENMIEFNEKSRPRKKKTIRKKVLLKT